MYNKTKIKEIIEELRTIQEDFYKEFRVNDIISNSKIFEVIIGNELDHELIPGHSGTRDAKNEQGEFEYKHFKETSSNHSWTFNDFSDTTIESLKKIRSVIFAHIDDTDKLPKLDWYYEVPGSAMSKYLEEKTLSIKNARKMINVSPKQIEENLGISRTTLPEKKTRTGPYSDWIEKIFAIALQLEKEVGTKNILTSNKLWEVLVAIILDHFVLSEQTENDAKDDGGKFYEYKVSQTVSWSFEDISKNVLKRLLNQEGTVLAVIDKSAMQVKKIYLASPKFVVRRLKQKLKIKNSKYKTIGKEIRRLQVSLSAGDLKKVKAKLVFNDSTNPKS
ncbi:MAG: hypothetical protein Q8R55_03730 [Candidatus Taylorbacteria bacterium]|nr:hypothetical protein [Candidatus Taylorbacteria bacterium]